jgi:hypothetical protein
VGKVAVKSVFLRYSTGVFYFQIGENTKIKQGLNVCLRKQTLSESLRIVFFKYKCFKMPASASNDVERVNFRMMPLQENF